MKLPFTKNSYNKGKPLHQIFPIHLQIHHPYAYDTHNVTHFCCNTFTISHCILADTLHANLQQKSQAQMKTLHIYVREQFTCFFTAKTLGISVKKTYSCQKPFPYTVHTTLEFPSLQQQWEKH